MIVPSELDLATIRESFALLAPRGGELISRFYEILFRRSPEVVPLFEGVDMAKQRQQLLASLVSVVENIERPERLVPILSAMGRRHQRYGALPDHYSAVARAMLASMRELAGDQWRPEIGDAWERVLTQVAQTLLSGYSQTNEQQGVAGSANSASPDIKERGMTSMTQPGAELFIDLPIPCFAVDATGKVTAWNHALEELVGVDADEIVGKKAWTAFLEKRGPLPIDDALRSGETVEANLEISTRSGRATMQFKAVPRLDKEGDPIGAVATLTQKAENDALRWAVEGSSNAMVMVDRGLVITYVNPATHKLIRQHRDTFTKAFPTVNFDKLEGLCVDIFHKNPSVQRNILADPRNLPYRADITVGNLTFCLNVSASYNASGEFVGSTLEWADVTAQRELDNRGARLYSALEGSNTAIMTVDRDLMITYINPASMRMMEESLAEFRSAFPGFDPRALIGVCVDRFHRNPSHQRYILDNPNNMPYRANIKVGKLIFMLNVSAMRDSEGRYIGNNLEWRNVTKDEERARKATALESMIEGATTNMMMCDMDLRITYCNPAVRDLLSRHRARLSTVFAGFDPNRLVGNTIDDYHINPSHQRAILTDVRNLPYKAEIKVGGLEFGLNATALLGPEGNQIGAAVEWIDYNDRAQYRDEVNTVISAATSGDLGRRGNVQGLSPAYQPMMTGFNQVIEAIVAPVNELKNKLQQVSKGDLTAYVDGNYAGDHALLKNALNNTLDSLNDILSQVNRIAEQVDSGAAQVSEAAQSLSQGATEQAAALEQITASMTEMASQTKQNAENATQASQLAIASKKSAESGNQQMEDMVRAMQAIEASSKDISKIIKFIDEIAFQTRVLGVNAAVEAARAGVHGKGFAVVAEEVRNLATRSANAAKETTDLIEQSILKVSLGTDIAGRTAVALNEMVISIGKVNDLVAEIAAASNEQAQGIAQANKALNQMDQVTQQNTANAEESAAASQELSSQAGNLRRMLGRFVLRKQELGGDIGGITPDMLAAFQRFLAQQKQPPQSSVPYGGYGNPRTISSGRRSQPPMQTRGGDMHLDPSDMINLDDDEFGKY